MNIEVHLNNQGRFTKQETEKNKALAKWLVAFLFFIVSFFFIFKSPLANAATSTTWSNRPSWAQDSVGYSTAQSTRAADILKNDEPIAPFAPGSHNIALDVGQVFLMGDLGGSFSNSIGTQLHYTYGVSDLFGFDSSFGYSNHSDGAFNMTDLLAGLRTNLSWYDKVVPYLTFGLGFYKPSIRVDALNSVSSILFGVHLGAGVNLQLSKNIFFGASLTFHDIFGDQKPRPGGGIPIDLGGAFTSFLLSAGYTF